MVVEVMDQTLKFKRASFAKLNVPANLREYRIDIMMPSPVGTLEEIFQMIKDQNLDVTRLEFEDQVEHTSFHYELKDGIWYEFVD